MLTWSSGGSRITHSHTRLWSYLSGCRGEVSSPWKLATARAIVRRDHHGTSEEPPAARLLGPGDEETGVRHAVVRPEPQLHLVGRAETLVGVQ